MSFEIIKTAFLLKLIFADFKQKLPEISFCFISNMFFAYVLQNKV